jgi:hypothetical protein
LGSWSGSGGFVAMVAVFAPASPWTCWSDIRSGSFLEPPFNESDARDGNASSLASRREKDVSEGAAAPFSSWTSTDELLDLGSKSCRSP